MSHSSKASYAWTIVHTPRREIERKENKCILATCGIWKHVSQQGGKFIGTGSLIKDFFPMCVRKIHLVSSNKVIPSNDLSDYSLYFKKSIDKEKEPKKLDDMVSDEVIFKSGLAIVAIDPNKLGIIRKRSSGLMNHRPFTICAKIKEDLRNDELYCHIVEESGKSFVIRPYLVKGIADEETYLADLTSGKIESTRFHKDYRKGLGAPITITVEGEAVAVGAITLSNNKQLSFVLFSQIDRTRAFSDTGKSLTSSSSKDAMQQETFEHSVDQNTPAQDGGTSMTSSSSQDARHQETFEHSADQDTPAQGNMSLNLLENSCYEVSIVPSQASLKGGGPCWFTFEPDLPSDITSGTAKFADLGFVDLNGVKHKTNCLVGVGIPPAEEEGWVTVKVRGKSDKTGKSSDLGETKLYYFDERKKALKQIVQDEEQYRSFFEAWNAACKGHLTDGSEKETKSSGSGCMNSGNPLHSLQGLLLLVYAAAETDARQFIELVLNSSAGKVVFNAYRCTSPLPEDVARAFGHEDTAQYLESINKRLSEDLSAKEERLKASHISELAEAVKNQSKSEEQQDQSAKKDEGENSSFHALGLSTQKIQNQTSFPTEKLRSVLKKVDDLQQEVPEKQTKLKEKVKELKEKEKVLEQKRPPRPFSPSPILLRPEPLLLSEPLLPPPIFLHTEHLLASPILVPPRLPRPAPRRSEVGKITEHLKALNDDSFSTLYISENPGSEKS